MRRCPFRYPPSLALDFEKPPLREVRRTTTPEGAYMTQGSRLLIFIVGIGAIAAFQASAAEQGELKVGPVNCAWVTATAVESHRGIACPAGRVLKGVDVDSVRNKPDDSPHIGRICCCELMIGGARDEGNCDPSSD